MELDQKALERAIVADVSDRLIEECDLSGRVEREVDRRIDRMFDETLNDVVASAVRQVTEEGFDRPFQVRDRFGSVVGEETTIRKRLAEMVDGFWQQHVDNQGKPKEKTYGTITRAEWVLRESLGEDFAKQFKQEAVNAAAHIKDGLRESLRGWVDKTLGELFHVRSACDQAEKRYR